MATDLKEARLIILRSPDGETRWEPVMPDQVPEWLKNPEVMGRLVDEQTMAQGPSYIILQGTIFMQDQRLPWYRVMRASSEHATTH